MARTDIYLKVRIEHDERDTPDRLAAEMCRRLLKMHGVRSAQMSNFITQEPEEERE